MRGEMQSRLGSRIFFAVRPGQLLENSWHPSKVVNAGTDTRPPLIRPPDRILLARIVVVFAVCLTRVQAQDLEERAAPPLLDTSVEVRPPAAPPGCPRPAFGVVRYNENYSFLSNPACRTDPLDGAKYFEIGKSGESYVVFGADIRWRYEY